MTESVLSCPLCGSSKSNLFDQRLFRGEQVSNRLCLSCGLVYQSPRMTPAELDDFYTRAYRELYQGSAGPGEKDLAVQRKRAQVLLDILNGQLDKVTRHLDIGCSAGLLLQRLNQRYACRPIGIEPGAAHREYALNQGLTVYASLDQMKAAGEPRFDLISMAHVLEHLPEPASYLASLREDLLTTDGHLLVEVPNLYAHDSFEVAHLVSYSPHSLLQMLRAAGFQSITLRPHGLPRSKLTPLYLTMLAKPETQSAAFQPQPERSVKWKRRLGLLRRRLLTRLLPRQAWLPHSES